MTGKNFQMAIMIKEKVHGNRYSHPVLDTGFMEVSQAMDAANRVLGDKFGISEQMEMTRQHRKRRNRD